MSSIWKSCVRRLFVCLGALALGFVAGYILHTHLIHWLTLALPKGDRQLTTLTIGEPFMTSLGGGGGRCSRSSPWRSASWV